MISNIEGMLNHKNSGRRTRRLLLGKVYGTLSGHRKCRQTSYRRELAISPDYSTPPARSKRIIVIQINPKTGGAGGG